MSDYMALQKLKYDIAYNVQVDLPKQMLTTQTPRFMLYPLVENAILHGLEGKGAIGVHVSLLPSGKIAIRISDTGAPMAEELIASILSDIQNVDGQGIGLRYVYMILKTQFGEESEFHIHATPQGNIFEIVIPYSMGDYYAKSADH